ncbi:hypothetical protein Pint_06904 [Pistacia integerrima]|uniref:Uncharacterized protein n=1 Tax=Pistacia integerrima TaxID=434235 RepID=A0ACC0XVE7_9ROSI|nr:hypothetical protein Pint_06904 [Pistacia integerrima]
MDHAIFEDLDVVIVGGGICGLATALALHRKGMKSVVMERSEEASRATGGGIAIQANGWRALDELGVASKVRLNTFLRSMVRDVFLNGSKQQKRINLLLLKPKKLHSSCAVRGFTYFPNGHGFAHELVRTRRDNSLFGIAPVTDNLAFWLVVHQWHL